MLTYLLCLNKQVIICDTKNTPSQALDSECHIRSFNYP